MSEHASNCKWPTGEPCLQFSTDGTRLGAQIAHTMGTTDEAVIAAEGAQPKPLTGMAEEQAEWEGNSRPPGDMHEPKPYTGELDWSRDISDRWYPRD